MLNKECNIQSKEIRAQLGPTPIENIPCIADSTPAHDDIIQDKAAKTLIREIDAQQHEKDYAKKQNTRYYEWIDIKAQNLFHEGVAAGALKCATSFNYYGCRDA